MFFNRAKTRNEKIKNPMNDLPFPIAEIIKGVDAVIVTHTHGDHWDEDAAKYTNKHSNFCPK